jgi:peptidyl-prolyl cis-trans isomerase D
MLQDIRDKSQGWIAYAIVGLIAVTFVIIGTGSLFGSGDKDIVAKVNGSDISQREVDNYYERYLLGQRDQAGELDPNIIKAAALEDIIQERAMIAGTQQRGFRVSEQFIIQAIHQDPTFQSDGQFNADRYQNVLSQNFFTDQQYRAHLASRYIVAQLQQGLLLTNFSLENDLITLFKFMDQTRDFEYAVIDHEQFKESIKIDDAEIKQHYDDNQADFYTPELVKVDYLELSVDEIKSQIKYTDNDIKESYLENIQLYTDPEKFKVAHILVLIDPSDEQGEQKALETIREAQTQAKDGKDFAELVKKYSEDTSTSNKGGELHWINKGIMAVSMEFDEAVYKLREPGDISEPVLTSYGYHLIKLVERKDAIVQSFESVKEQVSDLYQSQKAEVILIDKADELVSLSYEYANNLDTAAEALNLTVQSTEYFGRDGGADGIAKDKNIVRASFSSDVLEDKLNSELIELAKNHYVVLRVNDYQNPQLKAFDTVKDNIKTSLIEQKAFKLAKERSQSIQAQIKESSFDEVKKDSSIKWKKAKALTRMDTTVDLPIVMKAFEMPNDEAPVVAQTPIIGGDYAVIVLQKVVDGKLDGVEDERLDVMKSSLSQNLGALDLQLFTKEVKDKVKVSKTETESDS